VWREKKKVKKKNEKKKKKLVGKRAQKKKKKPEPHLVRLLRPRADGHLARPRAARRAQRALGQMPWTRRSPGGVLDIPHCAARMMLRHLAASLNYYGLRLR
jgi:hypothetical protein